MTTPNQQEQPYLQQPDQDGIRKDDVVKHLEMIQAVVSRMASNSFLLKGWAITLVAALFVLVTTQSKVQLAWIALLPTAVFWFLDGYFLLQEKMFRHLYDYVRIFSVAQLEELTPFSMNLKKADEIGKLQLIPTGNYKNFLLYLKIVFSRTLFPFYGIILLLIGALAWNGI